MIRKILACTAFFLFVEEPEAQLTVEQVITRSENAYKQMKSGLFKGASIIKSAIAETYDTTLFEISFCHETGEIFNNGELGGYLLTAKKYMVYDHTKKQVYDYSAYEEYREDRREYLQRYPQFNPGFFEVFRTGKYKLDYKGGLIHIYNQVNHIYLDSFDFLIQRFQNFELSDYGLQIREWRLDGQLYAFNCEEDMSPVSEYSSYSLSKTIETRVENPDYRGKGIGDLVGMIEWKTVDDQLITIDSFKNRVVIIDFFYQSCLPCIMGMKDLKALQEKYGHSKLMVIGIDDVPGDSTTMKKFMKRYKMNYPVVCGNQARKIKTSVNPEGMYPYLLLIDPAGKVVESQDGYSEEFMNKVEKLLNSSK